MLIGSIFAFAYIIKEVQEKEIFLEVKQNKNLLLILKAIIKLVFDERSLVSALDASDLKDGVATCIKGNDGSVCQEYAASECASKCSGECFPATRGETPGCKIGTCFDQERGSCIVGAPEKECTEDGGKWLDNAAGNVAECQKGCCVIGDKVQPLITKTQCNYESKTRGIQTEFRSDLKNELACLALEGKKIEGACVFESGGERACNFITKDECLKDKKDFYEGILCTNPELNIPYKKQASARCVDDKLYWFDDHGNKENIYDANKAKSWNNGKTLSADASCDLGNKLNNQGTCGNCNRFLGSVCGPKTSDEKLDDSSIGFVCKDMRCTDSKGNARENGESWCEYQGDIGVEKGASGFNRSVDTPGSRHFRASCIDGEVEVNACDEYRNKVCIEDKISRDVGKISTAVCTTNLWQLCISYNGDIKGEGEERTKSLADRNDRCVKNPMCQLKNVKIGSKFQFDMCVPQYPPGFDLQKNPEGGELTCAFANQKCTAFFVKEIGGWKCKANCDCLKSGFAEQMNDLCMSLGDCGASVNYNGDLTENYRITGAPKLNANYLNEIKKYSEPVEGKYARIDNISAYFEAIGGIEKLGGKPELPDLGALDIAGAVSGALGSAIMATPGVVAYVGGPPIVVGSIGGAVAGAAIGFAVTSLLIKFTGVGTGLDPAITWALIGAGTLAGAAIGASLTATALGTGSVFGIAAWTGVLALGPIGLIVLALVIIVIVVFKVIGIGDTKKKIVEFECKPWQPPTGGAKCGECGKDGYSCSKYSCQTLGVNCRLLNEGTGNESCVDIGRGDISAPRMNAWNEALSEGYKYETVSERGFKVVNNENDGCIKSNEFVTFGINLNEPGQCRYNTKHTNNYEEMNNDDGGEFGFRNLFLYNHSQFLTIPDMTSFGLGNDPTKRAEYNMYVRCIDGNGNGKDSAEYAINFCIKPGEDKTPPVVTAREPFKETVKFNENKIKGSVFTNEPSQCKWDIKDAKYGEMKNEMECANDVVDRDSIFGWRCNANLSIDKMEDTFYIKCKDQPWYGVGWQGEGNDSIVADESKRNEMSEAYKFVVKRTKEPLKIKYIKPDNETFKFDIEPATITLELETEGGFDGTATCKLLGTNMGQTFGSKHKQIFNQIFSGEYKFPITCEDSVGNIAEATSSFNVKLDVSPPIITRIYDSGGSLTIITDENSQCGFMNGGSKNLCDFELANATIMSGDDKTHTSNFEDGTYYIKCKDRIRESECVKVRKG